MSSWQTKKLGDVLDKIEGGGTPSKEKREYWHGSIPWASVKDLTNFNRLKTQDYITEEGLANSSSKLVQAGTLITPTRMALGFTVQFDVDVAINQDLKALYPNKSVHNSFLKYWFEANRKKIEKLGVGSTVAGIQVSELRAQKINLPEKAEQERIVGVLEVWDEYIEKLEQKIALKEQLKRGLMQQLLTGKRRLAGYKSEWKSARLGDVAKMQSGGTPSSKNVHYYGGDIVWVSIADMTSSGKYIFDSQKKLTQLGYESSTARLYPENTILYARYASIGECVIAKRPVTSSQAILGIQANDKLDPEYLYYYLRNKKDEIKLLGQQGTQSNLNAGIVKEFTFDLPEIDEQREISRILSAADEGIETLASQLALIRGQKKYLLKNLITGTIRTPENLKPKGASS